VSVKIRRRKAGEDEFYQVRLELVQVNIERTIETEGGGDGRDDLSNDAVEVLEAGGLDAEVLAADVVDG
jgi:hypothetical protein